MTDLLTPVDHFIREQQELTAVDRFSRLHDGDLATPSTSSPTRAYRDLLPLVGPGAGEQYAFEVDLDACSGCKACVSACHSLNGLDRTETWRSVGQLIGTVDTVTEATGVEHQRPILQTVTTACHHCVDPACLNGCPVDAYDKDPVTGIVWHLDDQCIGCSYCTLMCPYEVPVYDHDRGIVRKCDMCKDRLAEGEAPACVQGCPTEAISITVVTTAALVVEARGAAAADHDPVVLVPTAAASSITVPSTRYTSRDPLPSTMVAADRFSLQPSHAHTPLAVMLVLTQLSVGAFVVSLVFGDRLDAGRSWTSGLALLLGVVALGASTLHLGRPLHAWRAVIGVRHSWLSREIVAFGLFASLAAADALATWTDASPPWRRGLAVAVAVTGVVGVSCSALIYAATRRRWWRLARSGPLFALTAAIGGGALLLVVATAAAASQGRVELVATLATATRPLAVLVLVASAVQVFAELPVLTHRRDVRPDPRHEHLHRTARLLTGDLHRTLVLRLAAGIVGGVLLPIVILAMAGATEPSGGAIVAVGALALALVVLGELTARRLFFLAVSAPAMPGVMR
ncbi:MAG: DmsC/YnfH family molybdoenzyme membrane anchor subunit [Acidimicrobiales bacterium]